MLSFLDQFDLSARTPPANEPNNPALTLREVEEGLANRTPRRYASLRNSFEGDRVSSIEEAARRANIESNTRFLFHSRETIQMDYKISTFVAPLSLSKIVYAEFLVALVFLTR